ncbi:Retrovirus-related Pol polyprotein [Arachis hypogaea]|nr:Retrovirus-related Pol polyprotein [Arachis hypogaea]
MSGYSSVVKLEIEKFDGRINFGLWQIQVKDVLIKSGLHKALKEKISGMKDEEWEELDLRAASAIRLCLAKNVLANVQGMKTAKELWGKLEGLYQAKSISNRLLLKEQFHNLSMDHNVKISDHLSAINGIVSELEAIGVKIDDEDKALRLILSLPSSYEYVKPVLMYGKETLNFEEVASKLIAEERRMKNKGNTSSDLALAKSDNYEKRNCGRSVTCWKCGKSGHVKRNCPDKKYPHGIAALPWIRISCGNPQLHTARFRSVPRRNAWSGLISSEYTFMVEYDSSLNYDCRYRQWQQRIVGVDYGN